MLNEHVETISAELRMVKKINAFNRIYNPLKFEQKGLYRNYI